MPDSVQGARPLWSSSRLFCNPALLFAILQINLQPHVGLAPDLVWFRTDKSHLCPGAVRMLKLMDTDYFILHMEPGRKGRDWESQASLVRVLFPEAGKTINKVGMLML
ncbi:hypothetical protein VTN96DRAFT_9778 [Rasamsonia emersonii]